MVDIRRGQSGEFSDSRYWAASATAGECQGQPFRARSSPEKSFLMFFFSLVLDTRFFMTQDQGCRSWQSFSEGKNGPKMFRQERIYYFRDKCVVFARNCKFSNWTQYDMQYIPCNSTLHSQETLFLTKENFFYPKISKKCYFPTNLIISRQNSVC